MTKWIVDSTETLPQASMPAWSLHSTQVISEQFGKPDGFQSQLIDASAGNADFLARLISQQPSHFQYLCEEGPQAAFNRCMQSLAAFYDDKGELMHCLRIAKQQMALAIAMADITQSWDTDTVTQRLSQFADEAVRISCRSLLRYAHSKGVITLPNVDDPLEDAGLVVLAMGKLGARELNYSSDIDLMVLFEPDRLPYSGRQNLQHFFTKLAQDMCDILQHRTRDGYVFRTDLRLRPDPRSTPPAVNLNSAIAYYESVGQNWERAAMIKARPVVADAQATERFLRAMDAFVWRRHLDFAAIADINSIKRQIDARIGEAPAFAGHDVKLGRGGIREIEFFTQTQQLIWGGRDPALRQRRTADALQALKEAEHITPETCEHMTQAYWYLRRVEHHIQMLDDQQTHTIPDQPEILARLSTFLGYSSVKAFESEFVDTAQQVHNIYAQSVESTPSLSLGGNLVFTGVENDPATLKTLSKLGFHDASWVSSQIQEWHRGHRRATRSLKARQLLTELTPALLKAFSETADANDAFKRFDEFLSRVPVGVQIFSLLSANPDVLLNLSTLLGSAPALGDTLTRSPALLDLLVEHDNALPDINDLPAELAKYLHHCDDYEQALRAIRQFRSEQQFLIGAKALQNAINVEQIMAHLSALADTTIKQTYRISMHDYSSKTAAPDDFNFAIIGLGKLGTSELTFDSDLDLIFLYESENSVFPQRFAARLLNAFTLRSKEGVLYALDMRLRPGGNTGPLATSIQRFEAYFEQDGWDVEALALTRARIICSSCDMFSRRIEAALHQLLDRRFDADSLAKSIRTLRGKITQQFPTHDPYNVKHSAGGLIDLGLITQYFRLTHPEIFDCQFGQPIDVMLQKILPSDALPEAKTLIDAYCLQRRMQHVLRLCSIKQTIDAQSSTSLQTLVSQLMEVKNCETLESALKNAQRDTKTVFDRLF